MTPPKLTEDQKQEVLRLYTQTEETTTTLASRFGVSNTTVIRIIKGYLSAQEYEDLVQKKRSIRWEGGEPSPSSSPISKLTLVKTEPDPLPSRRSRRRKKIAPPEVELALESSLEMDLEEESLESLEEDNFQPEYGSQELGICPHVSRPGVIHILPLAEAQLPACFYLVVDRLSELITRPLEEFADLGQIPPEEVQKKTLPIFDTDRSARRFSNHGQRIIKVANGGLLKKVAAHLEAKGITRLLIDGQIYSCP